MLSRISRRASIFKRKTMNPAVGVNSGLRVLRSQSQQAYEEPLVTEEKEKLSEMRDREKRLDKKKSEIKKNEDEVKMEQEIRETLEDDEVDLASYDSFPASDPPSSEMTT